MARVTGARIAYGVSFALILASEIMIGLFVRDDFIRPYGGDVLVTVLICSFVRIFFPQGIRSLPFWVFVFALLVEVGQYFDLVSRIGLGDIRFFRVVLGSTFSGGDLLCYGAGCILFWVGEWLIKKRPEKLSERKDTV